MDATSNDPPGDSGTLPLPSDANKSLHLVKGAVPVPGYTLVGRLGRGGFGEAWEAIAPGGVHVALKFIRLDSSAAGPEQRGLEVIRDIRHPHLVDVHLAVQVADCLVIAMSLCGQNLMDRLRACQAQGQAGLPRDELLGTMDDVAQALDFLNEPRHPAGDGTDALVGVQHRDVKPHNIFLVGGRARLADFGLAKILESTTASHTGAMSPLYVAPEVIAGQVTQWTDQFSLALTYHQLRTGRLPFAGESPSQALYAHAHDPPDLVGLAPAERAPSSPVPWQKRLQRPLAIVRRVRPSAQGPDQRRLDHPASATAPCPWRALAAAAGLAVLLHPLLRPGNARTIPKPSTRAPACPVRSSSPRQQARSTTPRRRPPRGSRRSSGRTAWRADGGGKRQAQGGRQDSRPATR